MSHAPATRRRADMLTAVRAWLVNDGPVKSLVGQRVRPDVLAPKEHLPAVRLETLSDAPHAVLSGEGDLRLMRLQVDCYGSTRAQANAVGHAVEDALSAGRWPGRMSDAWVCDCTLDNGYDRTDRPSAGADEFRRRRTLDFMISYQRDAVE